MCLTIGRLFRKIVNKQLKNVNKLPKKQNKNLPPLKHILALLTWGQICTVLRVQSFTSDTLKVEHIFRMFSFRTLYGIKVSVCYCQMLTAHMKENVNVALIQESISLWPQQQSRRSSCFFCYFGSQRK